MVDLPPAAWFVILAIAMAAVVGALHIVAARLRDYTHAHDLRVRTIDLRLNQLVQLKAMREYRDLAVLPHNRDEQIRYLVEGVYPGDDQTNASDAEPIPMPAEDASSDEHLAAAA